MTAFLAIALSIVSAAWAQDSCQPEQASGGRLVFEATEPAEIPVDLTKHIDLNQIDRLYISFALDNDNNRLFVIPNGDDKGYTHGLVIDVAGTTQNRITYGGSFYTGLFTQALSDARYERQIYFTEENTARAFATNRLQGKWYYWRADIGFQQLNQSDVHSALASGQQEAWHHLLGKQWVRQYEYVPRADNELNQFLAASAGLQKEVFSTSRCSLKLSADVTGQINTHLSRSFLQANAAAQFRVSGKKTGFIVDAGAQQGYLPAQNQFATNLQFQVTLQRKRIRYFMSLSKPLNQPLSSSSEFVDTDWIQRVGLYIPLVGSKRH